MTSPVRRDEIMDKIYRRTRIERGPLEDDPCWVWTGPHSGSGRGGGYARMSLDGQTVAVHVVAWVTTYGFLPGKKQLDHLCRNRLCVNPAHLEMVTHRENQRRRARAARAGKNANAD